MDLEARVIQFLGETSGTSKAGNLWKKKEWLVETFGQFSRKVKVQCFGDRADLINMETGSDYVISFDLESREYNGRWYTDVNVFRVAPYQGQNNAPQQPSYGGNGQPGFQGGYQQPSPQNFPPQQPYGNQMNQPFVPQEDDSDEQLPF